MTIRMLISIFSTLTLSSWADGLLSEAQIEKVLNETPEKTGELSGPRKILFCWSKPDHPKGTHSYQGFATTLAASLSELNKVEAVAVEGFPAKDLWKDADLVVFNLTQKSLSEEQLAQLDAHLAKGGALMVIHQGLVQRAGYDEWAERIGYSFSWAKGDAKSKWGQGTMDVDLESGNEILKGFPKQVTMKDELYWNLKKGSRGKITTLATTEAPRKEGGDPEPRWPVFWTVEHPAQDGNKPGRVFCSVIGHFDQVQDSPFFRIAILRAMAWTLDEPFEPFKSLAIPKK